MIAVKSDGTLWGWGADQFLGQLGDGMSGVDQIAPVQVSTVSGLTSAEAVATGHYFTIALKLDGSVWGFGSNGQDQLGAAVANCGSDPCVGSATPVAITGLSAAGSATGIAAGLRRVLWALKSDGTVVGWGDNTVGDLGTNACAVPCNTPTTISGVSGAKMVAAGEKYSVVLLSNGSALAFGINDFLQLGTGSAAPSVATPTAVRGITSAVYVDASNLTDHFITKNSTG